METREIIARRVAKELKDREIVNLGIGLPTEVVKYIPPDISVILQSENGILDMGPMATSETEDQYVVNAGIELVTVNPGGCYFDSAFSFSIIRGGHVDVTVLGALEVDQQRNLANWFIPGKMIPGMGGAMDLVTGSKKTIIAMEHCAKDGSPKILRNCSLPLTAVGQVDMIVTEKAVIEATSEGLVLIELMPGFTLEEVLACTDADLIIPDKIDIFYID